MASARRLLLLSLAKCAFDGHTQPGRIPELIFDAHEAKSNALNAFESIT